MLKDILTIGFSSDLESIIVIDISDWLHFSWYACKLTDSFLLNKCTSHRNYLSFIYLFYLFLSVLDYCNLVNSHLKSSHWPDALKSMIFIFTITIIGPIETGKPNPKKETSVWFSALYFVWCLFSIVITKRKKKYITIIIKRRVGKGKTQEILRLANKQSQHSTSTYLRREMKGTKMKTKKISAYGRKKNQRNWHLWS